VLLKLTPGFLQTPFAGTFTLCAKIPKFYKQFFCTKVFCADFIYLQFGFVIFLQKNIGAKAHCKMLVELTASVNFINVKRTRFSYKCHFGSFFYVRTYVEKSCQNDVRTKNARV